MAIEKSIKLDNGIVLSYHRIFTMEIVTNVETIIEITSYLNKEERDKEKELREYYDSLTEEELGELFPDGLPLYEGYTHTEFISIPYDETFSIVKAYEYIKTLPKFKDASDVFD